MIRITRGSFRSDPSDGETVITGSFNFARAAEEKSAENLLIIKDKALAERYAKNWRGSCRAFGSLYAKVESLKFIKEVSHASEGSYPFA